MARRAWGASAAFLIQGATLWLFLAPVRQAPQEPAGVRSSILMLLALPKAVPSKSAPLLAQNVAAAPQRRPTATSANVTPAPTVAEPAPVPVLRDSAPTSMAATAPDPFASNQPATARTAAAIIAQARRDLPRIDKEILGKAKGVPDDRPETLEERLARGIAGAYVGGDTAEITDHYTAADGVVYTRITRGPHTTCYRSRTADFNSVFGSSKTRIRTTCPPANSSWVR